MIDQDNSPTVKTTLLISGLCPRTRTYLQEARKRGDQWGVFVDNEGVDSWLGIGFGAVLVGAAIWKCCSPSYYQDPADLPFWPIGLIALGVLLIVSCGQNLLRRRATGHLGTFVFVDARYWWQVNANAVHVTPIGDAGQVSGKHNYRNSAYRCSDIKVGSESFTLVNQAGSERILRFLDTLIEVRKSVPGASELSVPLLGNLTCHVAFGTPRLLELAIVDAPVAEGAKAGWFAPRRLLQYAAVLLPLMLGYWIAPEIAWWQKEAASYSEIGRAISDEYKVERIDAYLEEIPYSRARRQVLDLRDDLKFQLAETASQQRHSPAGLRDYLADERNTRHREQAQKTIDQYYDQAIAHLRELASGQACDPQLLAALTDLISGLKQARSPVVTLGFAATVDPEPNSGIGRRAELETEALFHTEYPELKDIATQSAQGSAICSVGETFDGDQIANREAVIRKRFSESLGRVLNSDLLELRAATAGEAAQITLKYHTFPSGRLYRYVQNDKLVGLLRGYQIQWAVRIQRSADSTAVEKEYQSRPLSELRMKGDPEDPHWAAYAVMLYSAFHDFSGQFADSFGLPSSPSPDSFSFADATGHRKEEETLVGAGASNDPTMPWEVTARRLREQAERLSRLRTLSPQEEQQVSESVKRLLEKHSASQPAEAPETSAEQIEDP